MQIWGSQVQVAVELSDFPVAVELSDFPVALELCDFPSCTGRDCRESDEETAGNNSLQVRDRCVAGCHTTVLHGATNSLFQVSLFVFYGRASAALSAVNEPQSYGTAFWSVEVFASGLKMSVPCVPCVCYRVSRMRMTIARK